MSNDTITVALEPREATGKAVKHLRSEGKIPAVIHDHGKDSLVVQGDSRELIKVWKQAGKHHPVQLKSDGKTYTALIKTAEFDPKKHQLTHLVFNAVDKNQKVEAEIPVHAKYDEDNESSPAERNSLIVLTQLEVVPVKALADKLPDAIYYNAEKLVEVGDSVTVADLIIPEGVEVDTEETNAVATVYEPSALAAANDAAGGDAEEGDAPEGAESAEGDSEDKPAEDKADTEAKSE